jgi:hypothetical protein
LHLSLPECAALKLAELYHRDRLTTRIILTSRTDADERALDALFPGRVHPDDELHDVAKKVKVFVRTRPKYLTKRQLENAIVSVFNTDGVLSTQFRQRFNELYHGAFTFDDYRRFPNACLVEGPMASESSARGAIFISYAAKDEPLADELRESFVKRGKKVFLASRDLSGGSIWEPTIREAIVASSEMLVIVTPNSKERSWVMIEAGAGWILAKRVTPCLAYVEPNQLPEALSKFQARSIVTKRDRDGLVKLLPQQEEAPQTSSASRQEWTPGSA